MVASNDLFLGDGELLDGADVLRDVPVVMVQGRDDLQAPVDNALALRAVLPQADLVLVEAAGHFDDALEREVVAASDRLVG